MDRHLGMADAGREQVAGLVLGAWDAFLAQAAAVDLDRPSRLPGWRAHEICVHLGSWDDHTAVADLIASARAGGTEPPPDADEVNAWVTATHRQASREEVFAAMRRNRDVTVEYLTEGPAELDSAPTVSVVGRLPLVTVLMGQCYELAVHGLDLVSCGAPPPPPAQLQAGLAALADVTGALAASCGISGGVTLSTPDGGWSFTAGPEGWQVRRVAPGTVEGPSVEAPADLLLDAASGRVNPVSALARRRLKVHQMSGLLTLAPIVQQVPGIPGGPILRLAARAVGGTGGALGRLFGRG